MMSLLENKREKNRNHDWQVLMNSYSGDIAKWLCPKSRNEHQENIAQFRHFYPSSRLSSLLHFLDLVSCGWEVAPLISTTEDPRLHTSIAPN